jgi:hypothetical protein
MGLLKILINGAICEGFQSDCDHTSSTTRYDTKTRKNRLIWLTIGDLSRSVIRNACLSGSCQLQDAFIRRRKNARPRVAQPVQDGGAPSLVRYAWLLSAFGGHIAVGSANGA